MMKKVIRMSSGMTANIQGRNTLTPCLRWKVFHELQFN